MRTRIGVLVAIMDGQPGADGIAFAPGSIKAGGVVPVTQDFDPRRPPIGTATLIVHRTHVYAEFEIGDREHLDGKYPALGLISVAAVSPGEICRTLITEAEVREVSICTNPNADPRIPKI